MSERRHNGKRVYTPPATQSLRQPLKQPLKVLGPPLECWVISAELCTVVVHWNGERNVPCYRYAEGVPCDGCQQEFARKKQCWLTVQHTNRGSPVQVMCLTPVAVTFEPRLNEADYPLTGSRLRVWRSPGQPRGAMRAELIRDAFSPYLPDAPETFDTLCKMWNGKLRRVRFADEVESDGRTFTAEEQRQAARNLAERLAAEAAEEVRILREKSDHGQSSGGRK